MWREETGFGRNCSVHCLFCFSLVMEFPLVMQAQRGLAFLWFCGCRYSITKALCMAFLMTFFSVFDVPVFWPILLCYWIVLFVLTMKRQLMHMIKYKYVPFSMGKQVRAWEFVLITIFWFCCSSLSLLWNLEYPINLFLCGFQQRYTGKKTTARGLGSTMDWKLEPFQLSCF